MPEEFFVGPIKCPNCESFVDDEASFCPYCSMSLMNAPWKTRWTKGTVIATVIIAVILVVRHFDATFFDTVTNIFADQ